MKYSVFIEIDKLKQEEKKTILPDLMNCGDDFEMKILNLNTTCIHKLIENHFFYQYS